MIILQIILILTCTIYFALGLLIGCLMLGESVSSLTKRQKRVLFIISLFNPVLWVVLFAHWGIDNLDSFMGWMDDE